MGLFSRRKNQEPERVPAENLIPAVVDEARGTARVGDDAVPIFPLLVDVAADGDIVAEGISADQQPIRTVLPSGLTVRYAFERPTHWDYVNYATAERLGHTPESLHSEAVRWLTQVDFIAEAMGGRIRLTMPEGREDLAASLVLRAGSLREFYGPRLDGDPVIAVANRVIVLMCGANDTESVDSLRDMAAAIYAAGDAKPVSTKLYRIDAAGELQLL
jgi:hypothetical protein